MAVTLLVVKAREIKRDKEHFPVTIIDHITPPPQHIGILSPALSSWHTYMKYCNNDAINNAIIGVDKICVGHINACLIQTLLCACATFCLPFAEQFDGYFRRVKGRPLEAMWGVE